GIQSAPAPGPRRRNRMLYHSVTQRILLLGDVDALGQSLNDLSQYTNGRWARIETSSVIPNPRSTMTLGASFGMAFDSARGLLVLLGGDDGALTGAFDGSNWT